MGQRQHAGNAGQRQAGKISDEAAQLAGAQRLGHRRVVDDALAGEVEQHRVFLHGRQLGGADQIPGGVQQRQMQGDVIRPREQRFQAGHGGHLAGQPPGGVHAQRRVIADHVHVQGQGGVRHPRTDRAQPHHAQGAAAQLAALEVLLALFHLAVQVRFAVRAQPGHPVQPLAQVARGQQQAGHHQLLDRVGVGAGSVEHRNTPRTAVGHVDVIDAGAGAGHGFHRRRDVVAAEGVAAQ